MTVSGKNLTGRYKTGHMYRDKIFFGNQNLKFDIAMFHFGLDKKNRGIFIPGIRNFSTLEIVNSQNRDFEPRGFSNFAILSPRLGILKTGASR